MIWAFIEFGVDRSKSLIIFFFVVFVLQRLCFWCSEQGYQEELAFFSEKFATLLEAWREGCVATISVS